MKISKLEFVTLLLTAAFLSFAAGWFLSGAVSAKPIQVTVERGSLTEATPAPSAVPEAPATPSPAPEAGAVNINTADSEALQTLPGIGEKRAADIIAYREAHGRFRIPEDLTKVPGIGEGILAGLIELITTGD